MAYTKAELEALRNALLASGQPITASIHRDFAQRLIDEMYDPQSRANLLAAIQADAATAPGDVVFIIRGGEAYLIPATALGGAGATLAGLGDVLIATPENQQLLSFNSVSGYWENIDLTGLFVTPAELDAALDALQLPAGARLIFAELILTSTTAGTLSAQWVDFTSETESVTDAPLTFNGGGLPAAGQVRFDLIQGSNAGAVTVKQGTEALPGAAVIPTADAENLALSVVLWSDTGESNATQPGGGPATQNDFSLVRLGTLVAADTTGKFAKVWEGNLSRDNNYSIILGYAEPKNTVNFDGSGAQILKLSFTCDSSLSIISETVQMLTGSGSTAGEFVLYEITGNRAALYHKSNHYWGRIQYRVLFQNSVVLLSNFAINGPYGAAPSAVATYPSTVEAGGGASGVATVTGTGVGGTAADPVIDLYVDFVASTGAVLFDVPRKYGFTTPVTGALTIGSTGAFESNLAKVLHNDATAPAITPPGGVTLVNDGGTYVVSVDNIIYFVCHKNDAGTVTKISFTITQDQT
jgi:hypothetical protein